MHQCVVPTLIQDFICFKVATCVTEVTQYLVHRDVEVLYEALSKRISKRLCL